MEKRIRVLEVISSLEPTGGAETFAVNFCISISKKVDLTVVILYEKNQKHFIDLLNQNDIYPIILNKRKHFDIKTIEQLKKIIVQDQYDFIHTENNALITSFFAICTLKNKPTIYHTIHMPANLEAGGAVSRLLYKFIFRKKYVVPVAISSLNAESVNNFYKISNCPVVLNGIDTRSFNGNKILSKRTIDCTVLARFSKEKNHAFLVELFKSIHDDYPNLKVIMAGSGPLYESVKKQVANSDAVEYIALPGIITDVSAVLSNSKIIVLGSFFEGNPICILEGMASGNIAVSSSVGGIPDIVKDGENGFLFEVGDCDSFKNRILDILNNIEKYEKMRIENIRKAISFSIDKTTDDYVSLFLSGWSKNDT